jgi:hypothetical protein
MGWSFKVLFALMVFELAVLSLAMGIWILTEFVRWAGKRSNQNDDERKYERNRERGHVSAPSIGQIQYSGFTTQARSLKCATLARGNLTRLES